VLPQDYFDGVERLLKTTAPSEVSSNSAYSKSALKKVVKEYNAKDVRKHVDGLSRRVEKHFTDADSKALADGNRAGAIAPGTVLVGVWRACEEELLRLTEGWGKRVAQCYADSGVNLEYTAGDVEAAFKKHRVGA
jgi:exocyst complex component 1